MTQLQESIRTPLDAPYLDYWANVAPDDPAALRINEDLKTLTHIAIRHEGTPSPHQLIEQAPPLQAEAWYRLLGPLNELEGSEHDLMSAAQLMQGRDVFGEQTSANLDLDTVYLLSDLARVSTDMNVRKGALAHALQKIREIETRPTFHERDGSFLIQTGIIKNDLAQEATRLQFTGDIQPKPLETSKYREFETAFAQRELAAIAQFKAVAENGVTDKNLGLLFEWYFIIARRHQAWAEENIDTVAIRGATSRENAAGWKSTSGKIYPAPKSGNHDAVITSYREGEAPYNHRIQLKSYDYSTKPDQYDRSAVTVIDVRTVLKTATLKEAAQMIQNVTQFQREYVQT